MLATLVIGLREGLEASLIIGIIAAFLHRANKPLRPMWFGVGAAVALSVAVGVVLEVISADLPQAQQEAMETIIGVVAVIFVTSMIGWMNQHARHLKSDLEQSAASALRDGTVWALVGMAFLSVLKEGFETSVFLLAAFQSATSSLAASAGAILGIAISVVIGLGIYRGGIKLNLSKFFRFTGVFLVLVAAGLVLRALRTAHEAGWVTIGQQSTVSLSWFAPNGSIQSALLTGVLGIPSDPRLIEVLGWAAYLIPVMLYLLWPVAKRPTAEQKPRFLAILGGASAAIAVILAVAIPIPGAYVATPAKLVSADGTSADGTSAGTATLTRSGSTFTFIHTAPDGTQAKTTYSAADTTAISENGLDSRRFGTGSSSATSGTMTLDELVALVGGRVPVGMTASQNPGPFSYSRDTRTELTVISSGGTLLDTANRTVQTLKLTGGGLAAERVVSLDGGTAWATADSYTTTTEAQLAAVTSDRSELLLWKLWIPIALGIAALMLGLAILRARNDLDKRRRVAAEKTRTAPAPQPVHA